MTYGPNKITAALISEVAKWEPPATPKEIRDKAAGLILRHQPSGYLGLYVELGRGKRERLCDARNIANPKHPLTFGQVRQDAKVLRGEVAGGRDLKAERAAARAIPTLSEYLDETQEGTYGWWVTHNRKDGKNGLARLKASFEKKYGSRKLDELTPALLDAWRTKRRRDVTVETTNRDVAGLRAALSKAVEWGLLTQNPLQALKPLKVDRHKRAVRALTPDEVDALLQALDAREVRKREQRASANSWRAERGYALMPSLEGIFSDSLKPAVVVSLHTGMRRSELLGLMWEQIDFRAGYIHLEGEKTKAYQSRDIPMNATVKGALRQWQLQNGRPTTGFVFPGASGRLTSLRKSFYAVLEKAGIERVTTKGRIGWHSLRHTFGSTLGARGIDVETLRHLMGHADIATTQRYLHSDKDRQRTAVEALVSI